MNKRTTFILFLMGCQILQANAAANRWSISTVQVVNPSCDCLCVDGVPTTLCNNIPQAQLGLTLCQAAPPCPSPAGGRRAEPLAALQVPDDLATNCRRASLWDRTLEAYRWRNICDVVPPTP